MNETNHIYQPTRREMLRGTSCGFGFLALGGMLNAGTTYTNPLAARAPHFPAKVKRVIFLYMAGAPSQWEIGRAHV